MEMAAHNNIVGGKAVLQEAEQLACSDFMLKLLELRLKSLPKSVSEDLISLIPELQQCENAEEYGELSKTMRELIFPELIDGQKVATFSEITPSEALLKRMTYIGNKIREHRKVAGMNQEQLSSATGLTQSHISRLESGKHSPSHETLKRIADALGIDVGKLDPALP